MKTFEQFMASYEDDKFQIKNVHELGAFLKHNASSVLRLGFTASENSDEENESVMQQNLEVSQQFLNQFIARYQDTKVLSNLYFAVFDLSKYNNEKQPPDTIELRNTLNEK